MGPPASMYTNAGAHGMHCIIVILILDVKDGMCRMVAAGHTDSQTRHVQKRNSKVS